MVSLDSVAELISKVLLAELIPKGNPWKHCTANALDVVTCPIICAGQQCPSNEPCTWDPNRRMRCGQKAV